MKNRITKRSLEIKSAYQQKTPSKIDLKQSESCEELPTNFDPLSYLELNPDVAANPHYGTPEGAVLHWIRHGKNENREYESSKLRDQPKTEIKQRKVIYTCITREYDSFKHIGNYDPRWDYICFTDSNIDDVPQGWEVREIPKIISELDPIRKARALKILPHVFLQDYDIRIWVDGSIEILTSPQDFVDRYIEEGDIFVIPRHPDRVCVYEEAEACIKFNKEDPQKLRDQIRAYKEEGYPEKWGMIHSQVIYRKNDERVKMFCNIWWKEVLKRSRRDQMSFNYALWKNPISIKTLFPSISSSMYFSLWTHKSGTHKKATLRKDYDALQNYINGRPI
jgi:hypothetical protein